MRAIHIYVEGGGPTNRTQSPLREGFDGFFSELKSLAKSRDVFLRFVFAGSRKEAFEDFQTSRRTNPERINLLLVDSESAVLSLPCVHLKQRDGWALDGVDEEHVHLMAQCMEAWLLADPEAMAEYYNQGFNANALPVRINLEEEPKTQISAALESATRHTQKGRYHKIKHASELLKRVSAQKAQNRCPHCKRFFETVTRMIQA